MSKTLLISSAVDKTGANPGQTRNMYDKSADLRTTTPKVKYNGDLNGYHFQVFDETFICREELPQGSKTFQQVLEEITQEIDSTKISEEPMQVSAMNNRRKTLATLGKRSDTGFLRKGRVSWGKPLNSFSDSARQIRRQSSTFAFTRPRVCSDGAVVRTPSFRS